jgi:transposase-like protein
MDKLDERRVLYAEGLNDSEIARRQGVAPSAVHHWRTRHGLRRNSSPGQIGHEALPMRRLLYSLGWGEKRIARYQGVNLSSVEEWRKRHGITPQNSRRKDVGEADFQRLQRRVVRAVGCSLPPDIAADAAASLMLAVIEGDVALDAIETRARTFGNKALNDYANAFAMRSLDEDIPDRDGLRPIDMLVDEASSDWLEEMGATVH